MPVNLYHAHCLTRSAPPQQITSKPINMKFVDFVFATLAVLTASASAIETPNCDKDMYVDMHAFM